MSDRCEPPEGLREPWSRHWVKPPAQAPFIAIWFWDKWFNGGADGDPSPKGWAKSGYRYICPVPTPTEIAAKDAEIKRLQAENATLRLTLGGKTFTAAVPALADCPKPGACAQVAEIERLKRANAALVQAASTLMRGIIRTPYRDSAGLRFGEAVPAFEDLCDVLDAHAPDWRTKP